MSIEMPPSAEIMRFQGAECWRNCVCGFSRARNAGEIIAFLGVRAQPSAEIVRVEGAECR